VGRALSGEHDGVALKGANFLQAVPMLLNQAEVKGGAAWRQPVGGCRALGRHLRRGSQQRDFHQTMSQDEVTTRLEEFGRNPSLQERSLRRRN
jgi:hypothetical protein